MNMHIFMNIFGNRSTDHKGPRRRRRELQEPVSDTKLYDYY